MQPTHKIYFIFMFSSFEGQLWRTFSQIDFLEVITGDSSSFMKTILSCQKERKKKFLLVCYRQASLKTNNSHMYGGCRIYHHQLEPNCFIYLILILNASTALCQLPGSKLAPSQLNPGQTTHSPTRPRKMAE